MAINAQGGAPGASLADQPRTMGIAAMTLFAVSAMITLDTVATSSALGVQSITLFALFALIFFVPYGLMTAELGSGWPEEGGIYVWVREAYGQRWGTFTAWLYWVNVAYWAPAVFVVFAGTLAVAFWPGMSRTWEEIIVVGLIWLMVLIGILPMAFSKWVNSASAVVKVAVLVMLGVMGMAYAVKHGTANSFSAREWVPSFGANWSFLPIIIYNFMGFELMSSAAGAVKNPRRDIPRMLLFAGAIIVGAQLLGNFGILAAVPLGDLSIVSRHGRRDEADLRLRARRRRDCGLRCLHRPAALQLHRQHGDLVDRRQPQHGLDRSRPLGPRHLRPRQQALHDAGLCLRADGRRWRPPSRSSTTSSSRRRRASSGASSR